MSSLTLTTNNQASVYIHKPLSSTSNVVQTSQNSTTGSSNNSSSLQLQQHHLSSSNVNSKPPTTTSTSPHGSKFYASLGNPKGSIPKSASASDGRLSGSYLPPPLHAGTTTTNLPSAGSQRTSLNSNRSNLTMNRHSASFTRTPTGTVPTGSGPSGTASKLQTSGAEHVLTSHQHKNSQQPQLHSQNSGPVPDTLLNSAFIFPNNHVRRNSLQNSPLLSQPSSLNSSAMMENDATDALHTPPTSTGTVAGSVSGGGGGTTRHSFTSFTPGGSKMPPTFERSSSEGEPDYVRRLEEENALMCEELQATVVELSEARELVRQMGLLKDQGEARLQSILHCMYEQNTVLDQCCGQMDFLRALVDESGPQKIERKSKSVDAFEDTHPTSTSSAILDGSTDEEADTEKTPEEVSASCVRKLNRLEVLLKHKLKEDRAIRIDMKKTKQSLSDQKMENEMLRIRLESLHQKRNSEQFDAPSSLNLTNSSTTRNFSESDASSTASSPTVASNAKALDMVAKQYEELFRTKETEIAKLKEDLQRAIRGNNAIDTMRRLQPGQAAKEEVLALQERLDKLTKEKEEVVTARDELTKEIIKVRAELTMKIDHLSLELRQMESERDEWRGRFGEVEKEIQYVKEITEEKMEDMAVALVVAHDFQVEESQRKQEIEKELENAKAQLAQLESEFRIQRSESESMKRNLETEREAHRVELDREKKHAEELSSNVCQLKKQLGDSTNKQNEPKPSPLTMTTKEPMSNKSPITTPTTPSREKPPKIIRMSSLNEPPSPLMSLKTPIDVDADVDDDCVDNAPIIKNVRSMVENFESPGSGFTGGGNGVGGGGSSAPKQRRYSGAKRRTLLPSSQSLDERLSDVAGDCNTGGAGGGLDVGSGDVCATAESSQQSIINKVSSAIKSINEKCEAMEQSSCVGINGGGGSTSSANTTTPKMGTGHPKRPLRSQTSAFELSTKVPYRSPLNKLKINDIVVQRNSIAPRQKLSDPMLKQNAGSSSSTTSSDSENVQPSGVGGGGGESVSTMGGSVAGVGVSTITTTVISSPVQKSATPATHVITTTLPALVSAPANSTSACSSPLVTFTTTTPADLSAPVVAAPPCENRAVKELMQKGSHVSVRNALLEWCKNVTRNFPGVEVTNFSSSWSDGLAFCALFYSSASSNLLKQTPPFSQLVRQSSKADNFDVAQKLAKLMGVKFELDVESIMKAERPDWKVILPVIRTIFEDISTLDTPTST